MILEQVWVGGEVWYFDREHREFYDYDCKKSIGLGGSGHVPVTTLKGLDSLKRNGDVYVSKYDALPYGAQGTCLREIAGHCVKGCLLDCKSKNRLPPPYVEIIRDEPEVVDVAKVLQDSSRLRLQCAAMKPIVDVEKSLNVARGTMERASNRLGKMAELLLVRRILAGNTRLVGDTVRGHG